MPSIILQYDYTSSNAQCCYHGLPFSPCDILHSVVPTHPRAEGTNKGSRAPASAMASTSTMDRHKVMDRIWSTRMYTEGATLQVPRKVPMRVEPKSYFALERTFLSWMGMAITLGGVSSALVGFSGKDKEQEGKLISSWTINVITCIYTPLAILIMCYALFTYEFRSKFLRQKQLGFFDDRFGPGIVAALVLLTLIVVFAIAMWDFIA